MKAPIPFLSSIETACFRISAHVVSRLLRGDIRTEVRRLEAQPKTRSYIEVAAVFVGLFGLAILAAGFGVWGLCVYFAAILVVFR